MSPATHLRLVAGLLLTAAGCSDPGEPDLVWGRRGVIDGDLATPRAGVIINDSLYLVDMTARIQAFSLDGEYLGLTWSTPDCRNGRPGGLGVTRDGHLIVCDSHYHVLRVYTPGGQHVRDIGGGAGSGPGQFGYVSDCVQDADGFFYVSENGLNQRITKLDADGRFVKSWGGPGSEPGQFYRATSLALGPDGLLYVTDAANHRVQVFTRDGELVRAWGEAGPAPGQLNEPHDLAFSPDGLLYVVERGNHRVQKFTPGGEFVDAWGGPGRAPGLLNQPWGLVVDREGRVHVIDSKNHRVQRVEF